MATMTKAEFWVEVMTKMWMYKLKPATEYEQQQIARDWWARLRFVDADSLREAVRRVNSEYDGIKIPTLAHFKLYLPVTPESHQLPQKTEAPSQGVPPGLGRYYRILFAGISKNPFAKSMMSALKNAKDKAEANEVLPTIKGETYDERHRNVWLLAKKENAHPRTVEVLRPIGEQI